MLPTDMDLRTVLMKEIRNDPKSISGISRELKAKGIKLHKLVITGYLMALSDLGHIKAKDIPPSKVYYATSPKKLDIYKIVSEHLYRWDIPPGKKMAITLYTLERIFKRPIFLEELKRADAPPVDRMPRTTDEGRAEIRKILGKTDLDIPRSDPLYTSDEKYPEEYDRLMAEIILDAFSSSTLARGGGKQTFLKGL